MGPTTTPNDAAADDKSNEPRPSTRAPTSQKQDGEKGLYDKELRCMMYGFGDDKNPYTESVELLEELVLKYITETTQKAMQRGKITLADMMYVIRKDKRKRNRVEELLLMNEELKKSRKAFDIELLAHKHC